MPYVSCMYAPPNAMTGMAPKEDGHKDILCTDENGVVWSLTEDSQVGDWLRYVEAGGQVAAYEAPEEDEEEPDV